MRKINEDRLDKLVLMASQMRPEEVAEATKNMEEELAEKFRKVDEEKSSLLEFQKTLSQTVERLTKNTKNNASEHVDSLLENKPLPAIKPELLPDDILLNALRYENLESFVSLMKIQNLPAEAQIRFVTDSEPHPLLHWASLDNRLEVIHYLMQELKSNNKGKLVDQRNCRGETALHWACIKGHTQVIDELINKYDADFHLTDMKGFSAMHHAAQNDQVLIMEQLTRIGLQVDVRDNDGRTPLHWAAYKGFEKSVRWLLSHGADPFVKDCEKCLPIHWASIRGHVAIIQILVELGGSGPALKLKDITGGTPQSLAEIKIERIKEQQNEQSSSTIDSTLINYEQIVRYCRERSKVEEAILEIERKPNLLLRRFGKLPLWSYFLLFSIYIYIYMHI